ncbi:MAG: hypothetical protein M3305_05230 [Actinomycetota bacterium]|nr:hypothetical protein [Actinomycetota bacterium]
MENVAALGRQAGFGLEVERAKDVLVLRVEAAPGVEVRLTLGSSEELRRRPMRTLCTRT